MNESPPSFIQKKFLAVCLCTVEIKLEQHVIITKMSEYAVGKQLGLFESDVKAKRESGTLSCIPPPLIRLSNYQTFNVC